MVHPDPVVPDPVMSRVAEGIALSNTGDRVAARTLLGQLWDEIGAERGDPLHRCAVAHSLADAQDEVEAELGWDLAALAAAEELNDERLTEGGVAVGVTAFYPSLHLNLGDCYRRLGDLERARHHLRQGQQAVAVLGGDGYATMLRDGLARLAERLGS